MDAAMGNLAHWYESKRLMVYPRTDIESLRRLIPVDDDPLLLAVYDDVSDPQSLAIASAQQSKAGQRRRRLRRLARSGRRGAVQGHSQATNDDQ
ncbi:hypothetical protein ACFO9E_14230 [Streptomyces maoxianensis]|uniref:Uncharacterized protein n=1 Tax=Streptomyces maoxianensis TaxID=1459942 RepID=A0ABV9G8K5_9ACTN